tara:strand:- start:13769 stop:14476 length:708 start_codon:yes stop_codon:yes gene_type:complete
MVSGNGRVENRLEALESEFNLLKTEIRQTLVDVKEFVMKGRSINTVSAPVTSNPILEPDSPVQSDFEDASISKLAQDQSPSLDSQGADTDDKQPAVNPHLQTRVSLSSSALAPSNMNDSAMMKNIIWWLGTARRRGITLGQISPFIEAYEMSGYMSPLVSKLIYKTMAQLADEDSTTPPQRMPQDFSDGLMQLNEIITTPNYDIQQKNLMPEDSAHSDQLLSGPDGDNDWDTTQI